MTLCVITDRIDDLNTARNGFNAFSIAVLINIFRNANTTLEIEWYIVSSLVIVLPLCASLAVASEKDRLKSRLAISINFIIYGVFLLALPWHSFKRIDAGRKSNCEIKVWCWHSVYVYHAAYRNFTKAFSIIGAVFGVLSLASVYLAFTNTISLARFGVSDDWLRTLGRSSRKLYLSCALGCTLPTGLLAIPFIEKTIQINDLNMSEGPITAASQLVPLVIGSYVLVNIVMAMLKEPFLRRVQALHRYWSSQQRRQSRKPHRDIEAGQHIAEGDGSNEVSENKGKDS